MLVAKQEFDVQKQQLEAAEVEQAIKQNPHFLDTPLPQSESEIFDDLCAAIDKEIANLNDYGAIIESLTQVPLLEIPASSCMRPIWCAVERLLEPFLNNVKISYDREGIYFQAQNQFPKKWLVSIFQRELKAIANLGNCVR